MFEDDPRARNPIILLAFDQMSDNVVGAERVRPFIRQDQVVRQICEQCSQSAGSAAEDIFCLLELKHGIRKSDVGDLLLFGLQEIVDLGPHVLNTVADHIEKVELRAGLRAAMDAATEVNVYLNATEPWKALKEEPERAATVLWSAVQAIAAIRIALYPYLPHSTATIGEMLGTGPDVLSWSAPQIPGGTILGEIAPAFVKLEEDSLDS